MDESIKNLDNSILTSQKSGKNLKLSQISKFLSPNASTINKLNELSSQPKSSKKQSKFTKKSFKLNFLKLNDSKSLDESIICGDEIDKNSKFLQNKNKSSDNQKESLELESTKSCSPFNCPICSIDLTYDDNRQSHVNQCLDKGFSKNAKKKKHQPKSDDIQSKNILEVDKLKCDSLEKEKKFTQLMIEDAVPNCPICGKVFHTINSRQTHLKKCAQVFHIKTESLFELVKKQQDNLERDLARGLIPTDVYFIKRKNPDTEKKKIKKLTSSELTGENSNGIKIKKETKAQKKKQQAFKESKLILNSNFDRKEILATRFSEILCKNTIKYGQRKPSDIVTPLVKTKFKPTDNYLWNRCKYFIESEECFYVKVFLDSGKFLIGHQIFVEKQNKEKYDNVEIVNTQTAFLLAELNDQSNAENMSIYYSQTQQQLEYSALNLTTNRTMHDISDKFAIKQNDSISQIRSQYSIEPTYFQPTYRDTQNAYNLVNSNSQILRSTDQYKNEKNR